MAAEDNFPNITEWMDHQTIFITGGSGFLGKVLLYKLLKSCSNVETVYVLIRSKRGKTMEERINQLLAREIFDEFRTKNPEVLTKIKGIAGDICMERLGLQESDWQLLQKEVTSVFHVAASVRFDDTLQKATFTNLRSTKYALLLAKGMKNLKAFVHVSTAYTNCRYLHIPEKVIPTEFDPEKIITIAEKFDEHQLQVLSQNLITDYPNTYIFTKNLAEDLVYQHRYDLPVVIIRPSIVVSSNKEPKPGWCDSISSIVAIFGAGGKGVLRVIYSSPNTTMDYIAPDACVNAMIVAAWHRNKQFTKSDNTNQEIVFNATDMEATNGFMDKTFNDLQYTFPLRNQLWRGFTVNPQNYWYFLFLTILLHVVPGLILDAILKFKGRKPMLMKIYRTLYMVQVNVKLFAFTTFKFDTENFKMLQNVVPEKERNIFFVDSLFDITLEQYLNNACIGGRHLVGDPPEVYKEDVVRVHRLYWIDIIFRLILVGLFIWILPLRSVFDWTLFKMSEYQEYWNEISEN